MTIKKRRMEIIAFAMERPVSNGGVSHCPFCKREIVWLTTAQAAVLAKVGAQSIRRWLSQGKAHGVRTVGGHHRICRQSLFIYPHQEIHSRESGYQEVIYEGAK